MGGAGRPEARAEASDASPLEAALASALAEARRQNELLRFAMLPADGRRVGRLVD